MKFMGNVVLILRKTTTNNNNSVTWGLPVFLTVVLCVYSNFNKVGFLIGAWEGLLVFRNGYTAHLKAEQKKRNALSCK